MVGFVVHKGGITLDSVFITPFLILVPEYKDTNYQWKELPEKYSWKEFEKMETYYVGDSGPVGGMVIANNPFTIQNPEFKYIAADGTITEGPANVYENELYVNLSFLIKGNNQRVYLKGDLVPDDPTEIAQTRTFLVYINVRDKV